MSNNPADLVKAAQVTVDTTAGGKLIVPARSGRAAVTIIQEGTTDVRLGDQGVTTGTGALLTGTKGASVTIQGGAAVYGIVGAGTQAVSYIESF